MNRRDFLQLTVVAGLSHQILRTHPAYGIHTDAPMLTEPPGKALFPYVARYEPLVLSHTYGGWTGKTFKATGFFRVVKDQRWWIVTPEGNAFLSFGINHLVPDLFTQDYQKEQWQNIFGIKDSHNWQAYKPALRKWFLQTCCDFGFNTVGVHNSLQVINGSRPEMAYMQPIH